MDRRNLRGNAGPGPGAQNAVGSNRIYRCRQRAADGIGLRAPSHRRRTANPRQAVGVAGADSGGDPVPGLDQRKPRVDLGAVRSLPGKRAGVFRKDLRPGILDLLGVQLPDPTGGHGDNPPRDAGISQIIPLAEPPHSDWNPGALGRQLFVCDAHRSAQKFGSHPARVRRYRNYAGARDVSLAAV